jgi:hypothetical protein
MMTTLKVRFTIRLVIFIIDVRNPLELDLFALETTARKMIFDLV